MSHADSSDATAATAAAAVVRNPLRPEPKVRTE